MGKGVHQGCILSLLFNLYAEYIMQNVRLDDVQAGITGESPGGKIGWILNLHFIPGYTPRNQNLDLKK